MYTTGVDNPDADPWVLTLWLDSIDIDECCLE